MSVIKTVYIVKDRTGKKPVCCVCWCHERITELERRITILERKEND